MKKYIALFLFLSLVIYWFTQGMTSTFFQQDEWYGIGNDLYLKTQPIIIWFRLLGPSHFIPLAQFYWVLLYRFFGLHAEYYAINGLLLHAVASFLVFFVSRKLSKNNWIGIITAFLFATNSRSAQAFTNLAIPPATIGCFIVIMFFILYLTGLQKTKYLSKKNLIILLLLFFISITLREDGLILPILLIGYFYLYNRSIFNRKNIWFFSVFFGIISLFMGYRVYLQTHSTLAISISSQHSLKIIFYNALSLPFKLFVTNIFEGIDLFNLFWKYKQYIYTEYHNQITVGLMYTVVFDFVILVVFNIIAGVFIVITRKVKSLLFWNSVKFSLLWIIISAELLAVLGRPVSVVESRYLYLSSFGVLLILSQTLAVLFEKTQSIIFTYIRKVIVVAVLGILLWYSYTEVQITIKRYVMQSKARTHILADLITLYPKIPSNTIFYVRCKGICSKNLALCGVPNDWVLPFTFGPGWAFMVTYAQSNEKNYAPFFAPLAHSDGFLWDNASEGYKKIGNYGFGYFITKKLLEETLQKENLNKDVVIGLEYDESDFSLHDISNTVRNEIEFDQKNVLSESVTNN